MGLEFERVYRAAEAGEYVQCVDTGAVWYAHAVSGNGSVVVGEHFDIHSGDVTLKVLEPHCYWILEKAERRWEPGDGL